MLHVWPQLPQLLGSVVASTQTLLQHVCPVGQAGFSEEHSLGGAHLPRTQLPEQQSPLPPQPLPSPAQQRMALPGPVTAHPNPGQHS